VSKYVVGLLLIITVVLIAGLGYFVFQNQRLIKTLSGQSPSPASQVQAQSPEAEISPASSPSPQLTLAAVQNTIKTSIASKNFQALIPYMEPEVNFTLMSSECCPPMTAQEAASQMTYIEEGIPMDFNQNSEIVSVLKEKNPQLTGTFIGVSTSTEHSAAFTINAKNVIEAIQLSVSWKLYNY
jgi:hypothetical protein